MALYADPVVNETSFSALFDVFQSSTDNFFGFAILLTVYVIMFIAMKNYEFKQAFAASTFVTTLLAGMMLAAGLVTQSVMLIMIVLLGLSVLFLYFGD